MLGYRTFFTVGQDGTAVAEAALGQLHSWLRSKNYNADLLEDTVRVQIGADASAALVRRDRQDGTDDVRFRLTETKAEGVWVTQLTVHAPADPRARAWVWLDVDAPPDPNRPGRSRWTGTPKLAGHLLDVFDARDGETRLRSTPTILHVDDAEELAVMICDSQDSQRRAPIFVAGSSHDPDISLHEWNAHATQVLRHTVGLAGAFLLDPEATAELADILGSSYAVAPWTIRTYRPGVDPANEGDSVRHRTLGTARLANADPSHLGKLLGWRAREAAVDAALPATALRLERDLERAYDEMLMASAFESDRPARTSSASATATAGAPATPSQASTPLADATPPSADAPRVTPHRPHRRPLRRDRDGERLLERLRLVVASVFGDVPLDVTALDELGVLALAGAGNRESQQALRQRVTQLQDQAEALEDERQRLRTSLDDEQLDHAFTAEEVRDLRETVTQLRLELAKTGRAEEAWAQVAATGAPESFGELLSKIDDLDNVVFTGDRMTTLALDESDPIGTWAKKSWDALLALQGYAERRRAGSVAGPVHAYLQNTPPGAPGYSATRHAYDESADVKNNPKLCAARMLPVPTHVDECGVAFMGAHFKIAQYGLVSPRLHYLDDVHHSGKIYVGHLGPHLPTKHTN